MHFSKESLYRTEDENAMKEQWQRKKAPLSEQELIKELMKKKKANHKRIPKNN